MGAKEEQQARIDAYKRAVDYAEKQTVEDAKKEEREGLEAAETADSGAPIPADGA